jgi:putative spermidine/putrescine transport system permease protein
MSRSSHRPKVRVVPFTVLVLSALFFALPLLAMGRFALQNVPVIRLGWSTLFENWSIDGLRRAFDEPTFWSALRLSLLLALFTVVLTLALLVPTAIWVHLRLPRLRAFVEFLTILPYVIPAIALVAGVLVLKPHARWFLNSEFALVPFYVVLALPFTYRSIDVGLRSIDLRTLVDASRSLGAGWGTTLVRTVIPNLRTAIISASFLTTAVVLGEFTMANVLLVEALPRFMATYRGREPQGSYGLALLALMATAGLFFALGVLTRPRSGRTDRSAAVAATDAVDDDATPGHTADVTRSSAGGAS